MSDFETAPRGTLEALEAVKAERDALDARMTEMGRIIRASVREEFKSATSPVGAAQGEIAALEAERDALAAHVERLRDALNYGAAYLDAGQLNSIGHGSKAHMEMVDALSETPTTSLARLKAQWQAEALDELMSAICDFADRAEVRSMRDELRRQAEADQ